MAALTLILPGAVSRKEGGLFEVFCHNRQRFRYVPGAQAMSLDALWCMNAPSGSFEVSVTISRLGECSLHFSCRDNCPVTVDDACSSSMLLDAQSVPLHVRKAHGQGREC